MADDRLQLQRFELKYVVNEEVALAVREFVRLYLEIDEFGATQPNLSYPIHSLYLDSDELTTYWETINGNKNRFKLRLRFYENQPAAPVYFELKRRVNDAIFKQRGAVRRDAVDWLIAGHLPALEHLISSEPKQLVALQYFSQIMNHLHARPKAHVSYLREAWISPRSNAVRVTMDRAVKCDPDATLSFSGEMKNPVLVFGHNVVLELKFSGRFPDWFRELVRVYGLVQCSAAKYADGVALLGESRLAAPPAFAPDPESTAHREARKSSLKKLGAPVLIKTAA